MSAAEVIEQIKALPKAEQSEVIQFVERFRKEADADGRSAQEPIESIAERIFDRYDPLFRKLAE